MPTDVKSLIQEGAELTDRALDALIPGVDAVPGSIHAAMRHSTFAGGKRLRPVLAQQAAVTIAGRLPRGIERLGAAIEMLHTYSLIHDDLPALDNDDLRPSPSSPGTRCRPAPSRFWQDWTLRLRQPCRSSPWSRTQWVRSTA
jgi:geranylgeranyl pyrophosphate synthase